MPLGSFVLIDSYLKKFSETMGPTAQVLSGKCSVTFNVTYEHVVT